MSGSPKSRVEKCGREFEYNALVDMASRVPTINLKSRKWKIWVIDETDVTITVRVRPLRTANAAEFTFPMRDEFRGFDALAAEAVDRYLRQEPPPKARAAHGH